jgi:AraC-like DNA-binding protein
MIRLVNISANSHQGIDSFDNQLYRQFLELVGTNYSHTHEVADFARELSVTARKLSAICKQKCGNGAKEIINGQVIAEAKRSLQFSAKPIKQIAYDLSFATPEQFSHFFKKNTDIAPADYRNIFVNIGR